MLIALALAVWPASSEPTVVNNRSSVPISFLLDSAVSYHELDIKDRMFDYEFDHAADESQQYLIVKACSDDLKAAAMKRQAFIKALSNGTFAKSLSADQLNAMINDVNASIGHMTGSSKKLREKASKLKKYSYVDSIGPEISGLNNALVAAQQLSATQHGTGKNNGK